jgi:hypothetical protein
MLYATCDSSSMIFVFRGEQALGAMCPTAFSSFLTESRPMVHAYRSDIDARETTYYMATVVTYCDTVYCQGDIS